MRKLLICGAAALMLAACQKPAENGAAAPAAAAPQVRALTAAEAFRMAFGAPAPAARKVTRQGDSEETLTYAPARLVPVDGGALALVSTAANASDCHACSGAMAIHYFRRENGAWKLAGSWPEILPGNGFGQPPDWRLRADLGQADYIVAEAGWTGQGYTCTSADIVELTPTAPRVLGEDIPLHYDNEGAGEPPVVNIDGKLGQGPDGKLRVTFTGSRSGFTDYARVGGKLERVSPNTIDQC
jgi:hypothetical protein